MKRMLRTVSVLGLALLSYSGIAQRYITEQFTEVSVFKNVAYDSNMAVNIVPPNNPPLYKQGLLCDVYEPVGDTETERPLIIIMHTGSFLPPIINKQTTGNKEDSAVVEMCTRFARKGYVAIAMNYRIGWNPTVLNADTATAQLLQATYRGIQDAKNCVRYFRMNAAGFKIDTSRIALGGIGTGGYIALAYAALDKQEEVELEKFRYSTDPYPPMVNTGLFGDWNGIGGIPQLNIAGDPFYSTDIDVAFHIGGAMGDISWMDGNEVPILSIHCVLDPYAPYEYGNVIVPTTGVTVINQAAGGKAVQDSATFFGINEIIENRDYQDVFSARAKLINGGNEGLFPLILDARTPNFANQGTPWEWWDSTVMKSINFPYTGAGEEAHNNSMYNNPDMSKTKAMAYIDTIQGFLAPRVVCAMGLPGCPANLSSLNTPAQEKVNVYPNPNQGVFRVELVSGAEPDHVEVYDIHGKQILTNQGAELNLGGHPAGVYLVKVHSASGTGTARVVVY
ncbi:MAG TPA: hypothetical protein DIW47_15180 [Bacteroidetes bacterium]|nr:hypothetical protein [Bacteroidota bacterium]